MAEKKKTKEKGPEAKVKKIAKDVAKEAKKVKPKPEEKKKDFIFKVGKRKRAVAMVIARPGKGMVRINSRPIENIENEVVRLMLKEPFIISGKDCINYDFDVNVKGGGVMGQTEAARQSIARALVEIFGNEVKQKFIEYDRNLLVYDPRRTEPHKPPHSSWGPRRYKQRSKR